MWVLSPDFTGSGTSGFGGKRTLLPRALSAHETDMKRLLVLGALASAATLIALAAPARSSQLPFVVNVSIMGEGCWITVGGEEVTSNRLLQLARTAKRRRAIVVFDKKAPYRCIMGVIIDLQRARFATIDAALWTGE